MDDGHSAVPVFRTPEQVAPELGMKPAELRRYVRESGICTRLSRNSIMLHKDDIERLVAWVRGRKNLRDQRQADPNDDPFV